jgi:hypothetical protein
MFNGRLEIRNIARDQCESPDFCRRGHQCIARFNRAPCSLTSGDKSSARIGDLKIDRQDPFAKARGQILPQPSRETVPALPGSKAFHPIAQLCDRDHTQKNAVFVYLSQPGEHARVEPCSPGFGQNIRVQQEADNSVARRRTGRRLSFSPERPRGDALRNSARLPFRPLLRVQSSAATTTAVVRPCLVIFCGPSDFALSINSLNFSLASATVQVSVLRAASSHLQLWS